VNASQHDGAWPVEAALSYQHHFRLSGRQWSIDQPIVSLRARSHGQDVLLAALVTRGEDIAQVRRAADEIERRSDGLLLEEIALPKAAGERHTELRRVFSAFGDVGELRVGSTHTRERERGSAEAPADEWASNHEASSYRMRPHSIDAMMRRSRKSTTRVSPRPLPTPEGGGLGSRCHAETERGTRRPSRRLFSWCAHARGRGCQPDEARVGGGAPRSIGTSSSRSAACSTSGQVQHERSSRLRPAPSSRGVSPTHRADGNGAAA
jgi:hypothetical protein